MKRLLLQGMTMLLTTREMALAHHAASRVVYLHKGKIHQHGSLQTFHGDRQMPELRQFPGAVL